MTAPTAATKYRRHAVFWAPPRGSALARFGAAWLGWDAEAGRAVAHPAVDLPAPIADITATPRRYGFHGTLRPPFRLTEGTDAKSLDDTLADLAAEIAPFEAPPLALRQIGRFIALVPSAPCPALDALAARMVTGLDGFRAPPGKAETARRLAAGLTQGQQAHLARWGYPYVLDEFRFHLTLTGALETAIADAAFEALTGPTAPFRAAPLPVTEICLFGEDGEGRFHVAARHRLSG